METPLSHAISTDRENASAQAKTTIKKLAEQGGKKYAKQPTEGLRDIRSFARGMYRGHQLILQRAPETNDAPPLEQDEPYAVDAHECSELLRRHFDIAPGSVDEKRAETIATEYADHRRLIRLCLAGLNHTPATEVSAPQEATATPEQPAPSTVRRAADRAKAAASETPPPSAAKTAVQLPKTQRPNPTPAAEKLGDSGVIDFVPVVEPEKDGPAGAVNLSGIGISTESTSGKKPVAKRTR